MIMSLGRLAGDFRAEAVEVGDLRDLARETTNTQVLV